jgi:hypothetical protein
VVIIICQIILWKKGADFIDENSIPASANKAVEKCLEIIEAEKENYFFNSVCSVVRENMLYKPKIVRSKKSMNLHSMS